MFYLFSVTTSFLLKGWIQVLCNSLALIFCMLKGVVNNSSVVLAWWGWGSGQGREQHGISTFLTFSHTVMLQSADWRSGFYLHGNLVVMQAPPCLHHKSWSGEYREHLSQLSAGGCCASCIQFPIRGSWNSLGFRYLPSPDYYHAALKTPHCILLLPTHLQGGIFCPFIALSLYAAWHVILCGMNNKRLKLVGETSSKSAWGNTLSDSDSLMTFIKSLTCKACKEVDGALSLLCHHCSQCLVSVAQWSSLQ